jgi:hypothetical protein
MATIAGILHRGSGALATDTPIRVRGSNPPFDDTGALYQNIAEIFWTHPTTAAYSFTLTAGPYRLNIPATKEFEIIVPPGDGTYPIDEVGGGSTPTDRQDYPFFTTVDEARLLVLTATRVDVAENANGRPTTFVKDPGYSGPDDGVSGFYDAAANAYSVFQRE